MRFLDTPGCYLTLVLHPGIIEGRTGRFVSIVCHQMVHSRFGSASDCSHTDGMFPTIALTQVKQTVLFPAECNNDSNSGYRFPLKASDEYRGSIDLSRDGPITMAGCSL